MNKILIIEDDVVLLEMYKDKFIHEKFDVQTAIDGKDGLAKMRSFHPDIILLDLIMPGLDGFDVLEQVKNNPTLNKIPILVLTNVLANSEDLVKNWGVAHFLLKSNFTPEDIVKKVKEVLFPKPPMPPSK